MKQVLFLISSCNQENLGIPRQSVYRTHFHCTGHGVDPGWRNQDPESLSNLMDCSMPGFPVLHYLLDLAQIHVH